MPRLEEDGANDRAGARADAVRFVLVEPQAAGNVGAAARALKNLGFSRLSLVAPRCDPRDGEARRMAKDAGDVLRAARVHPDLDDALRGARTVIGTTRRTGKHRHPHVRLDRFDDELRAALAAGEVAAVFGREAHGLNDAELDRCTHLVHFPSSPDYPSFNLAQSVLLVAYETRLALERDAGVEPPAEPLAEHAEREAMYRHLRLALETIGFLHEDTAEPIMRRLRRMLARAGPTATETRMLRGIARQILWVSRRAGLPVPTEAGDEGLGGA